MSEIIDQYIQCDLGIHSCPIQLIRSRRKSIQIQVNKQGIICKAPLFLEMKSIISFLQSKVDWIKEQWSQQLTLIRNYIDGEIFTYLGNNYLLKILPVDHLKQDLSETSLPVFLSRGCLFYRSFNSDYHPIQRRSEIRFHIRYWYRNTALTYLQNRTKKYAKLMRLFPTSVSVRFYCSRWGACFSDGRIRYNWLIILAPVEVIDYVVVHELAHLKYFDHSKAFWKTVENTIPKYKKHRQWLKHNSRQLLSFE